MRTCRCEKRCWYNGVSLEANPQPMLEITGKQVAETDKILWEKIDTKLELSLSLESQI